MKKSVSVFLIAVMIFTCLPLTVFAAGKSFEETYFPDGIEKPAKCRVNVKGDYDFDGSDNDQAYTDFRVYPYMPESLYELNMDRAYDDALCEAYGISGLSASVIFDASIDGTNWLSDLRLNNNPENKLDAWWLNSYGANDPDRIQFYEAHSFSFSDYEAFLNEDYSELFKSAVVHGMDGYYDGEYETCYFDVDAYTMYFRVKYIVSYYDDAAGETKYIESAWSDVSSVGKNGSQSALLRPEKTGAPVIRKAEFKENSSGYPEIRMLVDTPLDAYEAVLYCYVTEDDDSIEPSSLEIERKLNSGEWEQFDSFSYRSGCNVIQDFKTRDIATGDIVRLRSRIAGYDWTPGADSGFASAYSNTVLLSGEGGNYAQSVTLNKTTATISDKNEVLALTATVRPENTTNKDIYWYSSDELVATVDYDGKVIPRKNGTAEIFAKTCDGTDLIAKCVVTVDAFEGDKKLTLNKVTATVNGKPAGATVAVGDTVVLSCDEPSKGYSFVEFSVTPEIPSEYWNGWDSFNMPPFDVTVKAEYELIPHSCDYSICHRDDNCHWYECAQCGALTEKEAHGFSWATDKEPTCTATGLKHEYCSCGYEQSFNTAIPARGHAWDETGMVVDKKATPTKDGQMSYHCIRTNCTGKKDITVIPKVSDISLNYTVFTCNLMQKTPTLTVKDSKGKNLNSSTDYKFAFSSKERKKIGAYKVTVELTGNYYEGKKEIDFKIIPANVYGLKAKQTTSTITLSWDPVKNAKGYRIYTYDNAAKKYTKVKQTSDLSYTFSSLKAGSAHTYYVKAYKTVDGKDYLSGSYTKIATACLPGNVTGFTASQTASTVKLSWNKVSGASGYRIYKYNSSAKIYDIIADTADLNYTVRSLKAGTAYTYYIRAYKTVNNKPLLSPSYVSVKTGTRPSNVTGLTATQTTSSVKLSWNKVSGATGYRIYMYSASTKKYTKITSVKGLSYTATGLKAGTAYTYYVKAYKTVNGKEILSASYMSVKTGTKTKAPAAPVLTPGMGKITVKWAKVTGATGYELRMASSKSGTFGKLTTTTKLTYTKTSLKAGKTVYFKVRAYKTVDGKKIWSAYSSKVSGKAK